MTKRKLYKENPQVTLNEDGTRQTLLQQVANLNKFVNKILHRGGDENN